MLHWINICLYLLALALAVPVSVVCIECIAALLPSRRDDSASQATDIPSKRPLLAVLIPAHNEQNTLGRTLESLLPQLNAEDRVLVVADNCDDQTAAVAGELGVEVVERRDIARAGKAYALEFGLRHLTQEKSKPEIVLIVDADCVLHAGAVEALVDQVVRTGRPAQALYLLNRPQQVACRGREAVSALAFLVRNHVRPRGLHRLGLPCPLTGSGMAVPLPILSSVQRGSDNLVEDMQLGIDLALSGEPASFCEKALVTSEFPQDQNVQFTQRTRWEHGHLHTAITQVPRLLMASARQRRLAPLALALDLCVPPLSLLTTFLMLAIIGSAAFALAGASSRPTQILLALIALLGLGLIAAWMGFGRKTLAFTSLLSAPLYILWKVPMYAAFLFHRQKQWVSTPRTTPPATPEHVEPSLSTR